MTISVSCPHALASARLDDVLDLRVLRSLATPPVFERGQDYAAHGHVTFLDAAAQHASATVFGSEPYAVDIVYDGDTLELSCSCPMGVESTLCKHVVAMGLELLGEVEPDAMDDEFVTPDDLMDLDADVDDAPSGRRRNRPDRLVRWLEDQPTTRLVELITSKAATDRAWRRDLERMAAGDGRGDIDIHAYQAAIDDAVSSDDYDYGFVSYRETAGWSAGVERVIADLEQLLAAGFAAETVTLAEQMLAGIEGATQYVDGSDGELSYLFERTAALHLEACAQARPDPVALAERLLSWALNWELDDYLTAVTDYADVLGDDGIAAYRRLAEQRWAQVPAVKPGDDRLDQYSRRFSITTVMEHVAEATGGLPELLDVLRRDRGSGYAFLRIAEACRRYDRDDLAVTWAEDGLRTFPDESRLVDLLSDLHHDAGRHDQALQVEREQFHGAPSLARWQRLRARADRVNRWATEREQALDATRGLVGRTRADSVPRTRWSPYADGSVLVEILLWDGAADAAWDAACAHGCAEPLWRRLADARADDHPADAIEVHRRHLDQALKPADNQAYDQVVTLLKKLQPCYDRLDRTDDFRSLVQDIRTTYKRRRNLISRLDRAGLTAH